MRYTVCICGDRECTDYNVVDDAVYASGYKGNIREIVSGGARGSDKLGEDYAKKNGIPVELFMANWNKFGKSAGSIRNQQMVEYLKKLYPNAACVAIYSGSPGTTDMINKCKKAGIPVYIYNWKKEHVNGM
jgi:hypothetical protein